MFWFIYTHTHTHTHTEVYLYIKKLRFRIEVNCPHSVEKAMATHSSTLAWKIPWTEEPGGLQSLGSQRVRHDWATSLSLFSFMHWRRKWQLTPVFLPGESGTGEPGGLPSMWSHRVRHEWSDLAAMSVPQSKILFKEFKHKCKYTTQTRKKIMTSVWFNDTKNMALLFSLL